MLLPILVGFGLGFGIGSGIGGGAILVTVMMSATMIGGVVFRRRVDSTLLARARGAGDKLHLNALLRIAERGMRWALSALRGIGGILEGEGAMLWVFVILLLIQLVVAGRSQ